MRHKRIFTLLLTVVVNMSVLVTFPDGRPTILENSDNLTIDQHSIFTPVVNNFSDWEPGTCPENYPCKNGTCVTVMMPTGRAFKCNCYDNYTGENCDKFCPRNCGANGSCTIYKDVPVCQCNWPYTGSFCEEMMTTRSAVIQVQSTPDWLWYIVTACILLLILLIVVAVVMPLYLWKHRNILILKIVYYLKPYEDDDEKKYDAFVSFKGRTEDEAFVYRTLALRLENEMNFKLCLHDRDFIPGEYISDQIIDAIDNSRRTILILSPDYCNSEWTKFEYHRAREEMLRNKTRIIPIMYKDISSIEDIDPTLNELLRSITYITWPGFASDVANKHELEAIDDKKARKEEERRQKEEERFWRKVHLTMPKKHKNSSTEPLPSDSCTVPLSPISNGKINSGFTSNDETPSVPLSDIRTSPEDLSEINVIVANGKTSKYEDVDSSSTIPSSNGFLHNNVKSIDFPLSPACEKQNGHHQNGLTISA
ncbi:toll-like receptor Tollo isoform X4 [Lingula anatina]|uniref:Toll-like receptor Tollo isoform X4 n=1 Tax=Lingula anatina TaxID=7574 RepID=A0A1S3IU55_LINAN|nr:toll-like receptor Tollo isoform X4 [Lingula anatina]|eukprot:XP_013401740.1 toll-like receptor Tollo isoform X4 [Lingula anatina]